MKLKAITSYNVRNGGTSLIIINWEQVTTVTYGEEIQTTEGNVALAKVTFSSAESVYINLDTLNTLVGGPAPKAKEDPKPKSKPVPKPVPVPKVKAKPKVKKEKKNETP